MEKPTTGIAIAITTHNRKSDVLLTLQLLSVLDPPPEEILVTADGCVDGTASEIRAAYPNVRVYANSHRLGSIPCRDQLIRNSTCPYVLILDDDSTPVASDCMQRVARSFDAHPESGVIAFHEIRDDRIESKNAPAVGRYVASYANCGAVMRRDVYLAARGFPHFFTHSYEEPDYALQCYALGYAVWLEPSLAVHHRVSSVNRDEYKSASLNARNQVWSVWMRCPEPFVIPVTLFRVFRYVTAIALHSPRRMGEIVFWFRDVVRGYQRCLNDRYPVKWSSYWRWMRLPRRSVSCFKDL